MSAVHGYLLAALLVLAAAAGVFGYRLGAQHAETAAAVVMQAHLAADSAAEAENLRKVREIEQDLAESHAAISEAYEKGKTDAETTAAAVAADLHAGSLRLRSHWAGCETQRVSEATSFADQLDAATRDREASAGRIVRAAAQCDAQVRGLQELLIAERARQPSA